MTSILAQKFVAVSIALLWSLTTAVAQSRYFTVQVESLSTQAAATALVEQLNSAGVQAYYLKADVPGKGTLYRVRAGQFAAPNQAREQGEKLRRAGIIADYFVTKYEAPMSHTEIAHSPAATSAQPHDVRAALASTDVMPTAVTDSAKSEATNEMKAGASAASWRSPLPTPASRTPQASSSRESWEFLVAAGASFWTHNDTTLNDLIGASGALPPFGVRQSFATGGRVSVGFVKNINERSGFELAYSYGVNNFRLTAREDGQKIGVPEIKRGDSISLGVRSHWLGYNYRRTVFSGSVSRLYVTAGGNLAVFAPNEEAKNIAVVISGGSLSGFKKAPGFENVVMPAVNFGGGWIVKLSDRIGLRIDARDYLTFNKRVRASAELTTGEKIEVKFFGGTVHNFVPTFGLVVNF